MSAWVDMKNFFKYRGLIYELAVRDMKLRYRRPFFGFLWLLILPFCTAFIYKVLFSDFMHVTSGEYPFFIHLITAILPWSYFSSSIQGSVKSVLDSRNIINQISFPKYLLPVSTVFASLINFLPGILVLLGFLIAFHIKISMLIFLLPVVILIQTCMAVGLSLLVASLQVIYRDVEYVLQIVMMALLFLTPAVYTLEELINKTTASFAAGYMLNPLVGITNLYRIVIIGGYTHSMPKEINFMNTLIVPSVFSAAILIIGYIVFNKYERKFSDYINV